MIRSVAALAVVAGAMALEASGTPVMKPGSGHIRAFGEERGAETVSRPDNRPGYRAPMIRATVVRIASQSGVPGDLAWAIALTESGYHGRPWPWTLNVAGEPRRYLSRWAMYRDLKRLLGRGRDLVDIGPMQVNWRYHRQRFPSPWAATDPRVNVREAATLLRTVKNRVGTWEKAVRIYHAGAVHEPRGRQYARKVAERIFEDRQ